MNTESSLEIKEICFLKNKTRLCVKVKPEANKTSQIKNFDQKLLEALPSLNFHRCDNEDKNSFAEELQDTEIAHAFEHTLLDLIGKNDSDVKIVGGVTKWNWKKNPRWTYNVEVAYTNKKIVLESVVKTLGIFNTII